jgi:hypothetical protein
MFMFLLLINLVVPAKIRFGATTPKLFQNMVVQSMDYTNVLLRCKLYIVPDVVLSPVSQANIHS